jgi:hypothetical protein
MRNEELPPLLRFSVPGTSNRRPPRNGLEVVGASANLVSIGRMRRAEETVFGGSRDHAAVGSRPLTECFSSHTVNKEEKRTPRFRSMIMEKP